MKTAEEAFQDWHSNLAERDGCDLIYKEAWMAAWLYKDVLRTEEREKVVRLRDAIQAIIATCPRTEPERYDGDNHGDYEDNATIRTLYFMGQRLRAALKDTAATSPGEQEVEE